jgi:hypothetical protein
LMTGDALQRHQQEADRKDQLDRPAQQAAGVGGMFVDVEGLHEERPAQPGQDDAGRQQEDEGAEDVDPELTAAAQRHVEEIDPHMLVALERIGGAEHDDHREHVPLHFEPGVRALVVGVADHRVAAAYDTGQQHQPVTDNADLLVDYVDDRADAQQCAHPTSPARVLAFRPPFSPAGAFS